jgi:hypothetical protein
MCVDESFIFGIVIPGVLSVENTTEEYDGINVKFIQDESVHSYKSTVSIAVPPVIPDIIIENGIY